MSLQKKLYIETTKIKKRLYILKMEKSTPQISLMMGKEHFIELIFIPAKGTSEYQPLDRRIFGILKSKLRSLAGSRIFAGVERFEMITKDLVNSWAEISQENLLSAWNIPKLDELVQRIDSGEEIDEENLDIDLLDYLQTDEQEEEEEWESDDDDLNYRDY